MPGHRLGGADEGFAAVEDAVERCRLEIVALRSRGGVGVDIIYVVGRDAGILHRPFHRFDRAVVARLRDSAAV